MTRPPEDDDSLEAMGEMFNKIASLREALTKEREGFDAMEAALEKALPDIRNALLNQADRIEIQQGLIAEQGKLIAKLVEYVNLLHERKEVPRSALTYSAG